MPTATLEITAPDDFHVHLRDDAMLRQVAPLTARQFARALVMPNLKPPVTNVAQALAYRGRILAALPAGSTFTPLMSLYLTDNTPPEEIARARASGAVVAVKYYPAGATTHSDAGVTAVERCYRVFEAMERASMPLLIHGEATGTDIDIFDRERRFVEHTLAALVERFEGLRIVVEHITTAVAADFVHAAPARVAATITPQHLRYNRNHIFAGGIRPHYYCLPILKRETDRLALVRAATGGGAKFFLGTDTAPHARHTKENDCGCAGVFSAASALELYLAAFEEAGAIERFEAFASWHGADFYGIPRNRARIRFERTGTAIPAVVGEGALALVPMEAGTTTPWRLATTSAAGGDPGGS